MTRCGKPTVVTGPCSTPARPVSLAAATDGQGVVLAVPYSSDARQRTSAELLARRVAHRLGCPVAVGQIQRGTLIADGSLRLLHDKGARRIVVAPAILVAGEGLEPGPRTLAQGSALNLTFAVAQPIGGHPDVVSAALELLSRSERTPRADTAIRLALPASDACAAAALELHLGQITAAGWGAAEVELLHATGEASFPCAGDAAAADGTTRRIVVAVTVLPGPFAARVVRAAETSGDDVIQQTLHASDACTRLIATRVVEARRR